MTQTAPRAEPDGVDPYDVDDIYDPDAVRAGRTRRYGPLESIMLKPRIFALPIVILLTAAVVVGFVRKPVYTAESQLIVGSVVRDYQVNDGQAQAVKDLTDIYSRLVGSAAHLAKVEAALGTSVPTGSLTAAPIANSPLIRLEATGASQQEAVDRTQAGAEQLVAYVDQLRSDSSASGEILLQQISDASTEAASAAAEQARANTVLNAAAAADRPAALTQLQQADAALTTANLKLETLKSNYQTVQAANSGGIGLTVFAPASPVGSDRKSQLVIYVIGSVLIGGLLGMALATLSANGWKLLPQDEETEPAG